MCSNALSDFSSRREARLEHRRAHPQGLELGFHPALELGRRALAPRAELGAHPREIIERVAQFGFGRGARVGDPLELRDLGARALQSFEHALQRAAILALEPGQFGHPGFDLFEPRRIGLDPRGVLAERMRGLLQPETRRAYQFERVLELGIDHRRLADPGLGARDRVERRCALAREHLLGLNGGGAEARGVGQHRALGRELLVLAGRKPGALELGDTEARELELLRASAFALA